MRVGYIYINIFYASILLFFALERGRCQEHLNVATHVRTKHSNSSGRISVGILVSGTACPVPLNGFLSFYFLVCNWN